MAALTRDLCSCEAFQTPRKKAAGTRAIVERSVDARGCAIEPLREEEEARQCAMMMVSSEPWITLGRTYDDALQVLRDASREAYVARSHGRLVGFMILCMTGAFVGYIQTICVDPRWRSRGFGSALIRFAEQRIFREKPNVFMCVSSFNLDARRLYLRLGYEVVGELKDYVVPGFSEILLRKTIGPLKAGSQAESRVTDLGEEPTS